MKRSGRLRRLTPLVRRTRLRAQSARARRDQQQLDTARALVRERSGGRCEAAIVPICTGLARHAHHLRRRSQGGRHSVSNLLDVCMSCHSWIHDHPKKAERAGLLVRAHSRNARIDEWVDPTGWVRERTIDPGDVA